MARLYQSIRKKLDIRKMSTANQLLYLGLIIILSVFAPFIIGLSIDCLLHQVAEIAIWGILVGVLMAAFLLYRELNKLGIIEINLSIKFNKERPKKYSKKRSKNK